MTQWLADDPIARRYEQRFSQRLEGSMIQWLADDQLDALQSEVPHRLEDLMMQWLDVTTKRWKSYDADRKIISRRYPL